MKTGPILVLVIYYLTGVSVASASRGTDGGRTENREVGKRIVELTYDCRFTEAAALLKTLDSDSDSSMRRDFFRAMIDWRRYLFKGGAMIRDTSLEVAFRTTMTAVVNRGEAILSQTPDNTAALFHTGAGLGYLAELSAMSGNYLKAMSEGSKALEYHEKLVSLSPGWTDAYLTEGLFNLYTCSAPWYLEPVLFILGKNGSKKAAHQYLGLVARKGHLARYEAEEAMALLYSSEDKFDSVVSVYHNLAHRFPGAYFYYQRKLISALSDGGQYDRSIPECRTVMAKAENMRLNYLDSLYLGLVYIDLAADLGRVGSINEEMEVYQEMIGDGIAPRFHSWAHLSLGRLYEKRGDKARAIAEYRWVVDRNEVPQHVKAASERLEQLVNR